MYPSNKSRAGKTKWQKKHWKELSLGGTELTDYYRRKKLEKARQLLKNPKKRGKQGWVVTVNGHIWPPSQVSGSKFPTKAQAKKLQKSVKAEMGKATVKIRNVEQI